MNDHDALLRAICDYPDDDTPRLVFADFLEENGEPDRAAFVRAQVELARTPPWEPFAVLCRHRKPEWTVGAPFRRSLPPFPSGWNVDWHEHAFRRGLGWRVQVNSLTAWNRLAPRLYEQAPVGELHLRDQATLDTWREFAAADWVRHLRVVHLEMQSPVEPVRTLSDVRDPHVTDIHFHRASHPGLSFLVVDLLKSPLHGSVRGLHFRVGYEGLEHLIDALTHDSMIHERLTLTVMGLTPDLVQRWCDRGGPRGLTELNLSDNYARGYDWVPTLAAGLGRWKPTLHTLKLSRCGVSARACRALAACQSLAALRMLDLTGNALDPRAIAALAGSEPLKGLRSLTLIRCRIGDQSLRRLTRAAFWANLVELELRDNPISDAGVGHLLAAPTPPDLTALLLDGWRLGVDARTALHRHFGECVILDEG